MQIQLKNKNKLQPTWRHWLMQKERLRTDSVSKKLKYKVLNIISQHLYVPPFTIQINYFSVQCREKPAKFSAVVLKCAVWRRQNNYLWYLGSEITELQHKNHCNSPVWPQSFCVLSPLRLWETVRPNQSPLTGSWWLNVPLLARPPLPLPALISSRSLSSSYLTAALLKPQLQEQNCSQPLNLFHSLQSGDTINMNHVLFDHIWISCSC